MDEREALRATVREFLTDKSPEPEVRRLADTDQGYDPDVWRQMATQLGLQGLVVPEELGGSGFSYLELQVVAEEMGAALLAAPFLATVGFAVPLLLAAGDEAAAQRYLPPIVSGESIATVALTESQPSWDPARVAVQAEPAGGDGTYRLRGTKSYVLDGVTADLVLVAARTDAGVGVFAVTPAAQATGLTRTPMVTLDATRKMAVLEFDGTPATLVGADGGGLAPLRRMLDLAATVLAAEQVGAAARCLELSAEYARTRFQFGRPIGSFQAIKHKLANVLMEVEQARSAAYYAAREATEDGPDLPLAAALAHAYCSDAFVHAASDTIQVHGGIGFTWEHPAHLYLKRAKSSQLLLGHPSEHRARLAELVGI